MPLTEPAPRKPLHLRHVECRGYEREDGLFDIEGRVVDTKTYSFANRDRGEIKAGEAVHDMSIRLTIDEDGLIHEVEAVTDYGPYRICPDITPNFSRLKGLKVGPGFLRKVKDRVGGVEGCTHLIELLAPLATTTFQTLVQVPKRRAAAGEAEVGRQGPPRVLNTCHAYRSDSEVVRRFWPAFYTVPEIEGEREA